MADNNETRRVPVNKDVKTVAEPPAEGVLAVPPPARAPVVQRDMPAVHVADRHPLLEAVHRAYDEHRGLRLSAADLLYTLMQQFALWQVDQDAALKEEDRRRLVVIRDEFRLEAQDNDWPGAFPDFIPQMPECASRFPALACDTPLTTVARAAAMMEANSKRYVYEVHTRCGIPFVELVGSRADWEAVCAWARTSPCAEIRAATATLEAAFLRGDSRAWRDVYKRHTRSGGAEVDGWITQLFPFYHDGKRMQRGDRGRRRDARHFPSSGLSSVPFTWVYCGRRIPLHLAAGIAGAATAADGALELRYGWEVTGELH